MAVLTFPSSSVEETSLEARSNEKLPVWLETSSFSTSSCSQLFITFFSSAPEEAELLSSAAAEDSEVPASPETAEASPELPLSFGLVMTSTRSTAPSTRSTAAAMITVFVVLESFAIYLCLLRTQITTPATITTTGTMIHRTTARIFALPWFTSKPTLLNDFAVIVIPSVLPEI